MFCPNCNGFITERSLIKSKVKKTADTDIEYEARCPLCSVVIGTMFWGKLIVSEELKDKLANEFQAEEITFGGRIATAIEEPEEDAPKPPEKPYIYPLPVDEEGNPLFDEEDEIEEFGFGQELQDIPSVSPVGGVAEGIELYTPEQLSGHYCPYCGGDLPNDVGLLPRRFRPRS